MQHFYEAFVFTLLHSLWQSAVLYGCYYLFTKHLVHFNALAKRNTLLPIILGQFLLSIITFILLLTNGKPIGLVQSVQAILPPSIIKIVPYLFYGYLLLLMVQLTVSGTHWKRYIQLCYEEKTPAPLWLQHFVNSQKVKHSITKDVTIWLNNNITTPMVFGFFKPVILIPASLLSQLSPMQIEALVVHELFHVKHNDFIFNCIIMIIEPLFWFNPWIRKACADLCVQREMACDASVINEQYEIQSYASSLLWVATPITRKQYFSMAAVSGNKVLLQRIKYFSDPQLQTNKSTPTALFVTLVTGLCLMVAAITIKQTSNDKIKTVNNINGVSLKTIQVPLATEIIKTEVANLDKPGPVMFTKQASIIKQTKPFSKVPDKNIVSADLSEIAQNEFAILTAYTVEDSTEATVTSIVFNEEHAGQTTTIAYSFTLKDGKIIARPIWMIKETLPLGDSIIKRDSINTRIIPLVQ